MIRAFAICTLCALASIPARAERPTPRNAMESEFSLYDSSQGGFRVFYVESGQDAVAAEDLNPADSVPDLAVYIGEVGEEVYSLFVEEMDFRAPLVDSEYLDAKRVGGDSRFDFYLRDFGGGDGSFELDGCVDTSDICFGYALVENDFANSSYPSLHYAASVLVSHEYFHAIQAAYRVGVDAKWVEGSAVWAEEIYDPSQDDFEKLIGNYLRNTHRPFNRRSGSAFDGWAYGAGLWPWFLSERFDALIVAKIWEEIAKEGFDDFLSATDRVLKREYESSLNAAWLEFSRWNLFTGLRADPRLGYRDAGNWEQAPLQVEILDSESRSLSTQVYLEGMSSRYVVIALPDGAAGSVEINAEVEQGATMTLFGYLYSEGLGFEPLELQSAAEGQRYTAELSYSDSPLLYLVAVSHGPATGERAMTIHLSSLEEDRSGQGCSASGGSISSLLWCLLPLLFAFREYRREERRRGKKHRIELVSTVRKPAQGKL